MLLIRIAIKMKMRYLDFRFFCDRPCTHILINYDFDRNNVLARTIMIVKTLMTDIDKDSNITDSNNYKSIFIILI